MNLDYLFITYMFNLFRHQNMNIPIESSKPLIGRDDIINRVLDLLKHGKHKKQTCFYYIVSFYNLIINYVLFKKKSLIY